MSEKWLAFIGGVFVGPYRKEKITKMFADGTIGSQDKISREGELIWKSLSEFAEFSSGGGESASEPASLPQLKFVQDKNRDTAPEEIPDAAFQVVKDNEIHFKCPGCGQSYSAPFSMFKGKKIVCQACSKPFLLNLAPGLRSDPVPVSPSSPAFVPQNNVDFSEEVPEGDITCPHCWKSFSKEKVCYISCHPDLLGDPVAGEFEQKRFTPTVYHSSGLPLDARGMPCTDMACPHCHLRIPASIVDLSSIYFSIAGAPSSGKSYFLTSMIHTLRKILPENNNFSFYDVDPVINSVLNGYEDTIFMATDQNSVVSLPKTQQIGGNFSNQIMKNGISFELPKPFIFRLQAIRTAGDQQDCNIVFYDNAGEHFQPGADTIANPATTHLAHSDGIVFLFDPLNDSNMRKACDPRDPQNGLNTKVVDQTTLFAEMVNRIRRHGNLTSVQTTDVPLIVAVGKFDTWKHLLPKDMEKIQPFVESDENFTVELDWNVIMDVSFAVREMMQHVAPALVAQAETFFQQVIFMPVSSFGCLASLSDSGNIGIIPAQLNPIWVELPTIVLLAEKGVLPKNVKNTTEDLDSSLVCKIQDGQIIFRHPVTDRRVVLPGNYGGVVLDLNGKKYRMPQVNRQSGASAIFRNEEKKSSVWE